MQDNSQHVNKEKRVRNKQNRQGDYIFKRYKYQQNKILKEQSQPHSEQYQFEQKNLTLHQNKENIQQDTLAGEELFLPTDIIEFQEIDEQEYQKQDETLTHQYASQQQKDCDIQVPQRKRQQRTGNQNSQIESPFAGEHNLPYNFYQQQDEEIDEGGIMEEYQTPIQDQSVQDSNVRLKINYKPTSENYRKTEDLPQKLSQFTKHKHETDKKDTNKVLQKSYKNSQGGIQKTNLNESNQGEIEELSEIMNQSIEIDEDIKGLKIETSPDSENILIEITDKMKLVTSPLPPGVILKCTLRRSKTFLNMINPQFDLYLTNGFKHVISAKKFSLKSRQAFRFSLDAGDYEAQKCIGSLNANVLHNEYWLVGTELQLSHKQLFTNLITAISYQKIKKNQNQRTFKTIIPPVADNLQIVIGTKSTSVDMDLLMKQIKLVLHNMEKFKFQQNVHQSEKNFVLFDGEDEDYHFLKFSKQSDHLFQMDIQHPLSPLQAMAIAMTRFDAQLK